ncbi:MAG: ribosome maturation factor RimM [Pseudomonadota bacterium]
MTTTLILLAQVGAPQGIKGEVRVKPFGEPEMLNQYGKLETVEGRKFKITRMRPQKNMMIVKFEGINSREDAEALKGLELYVDRSKLPEPDEDEFYISDLVGMSAVNENGKKLGTIKAVPNFGAGDMLEIKPLDGGQTFYLPFTREIVPKIDFNTACMTVIPPSEVSERDEEA